MSGNDPGETGEGHALTQAARREREFEALWGAARAILRHRAFPEAAQAIFDQCKNLIGAQSGYISLLEQDENQVVFLDTGNFVCRVSPDLPMPIRGLRGQAYASGKTIYDNQFATSRWHSLLPEGHARIENVMFAPLMIDGQAVGIMGLANKPGGFAPEDARIATAFAEIAAVALLNSRSEQRLLEAQAELEQRVQERTRELEAISASERRLRELAENLCEASMALASSLDLDAVVQTMLAYLRRLLDFDCAHILLITGESRAEARGVWECAGGAKPTAYREVIFDAPAHPILGEVLLTQKSLLIDDTRRLTCWPPVASMANAISWLGIPVVSAGRVIGICSLEQSRPGCFAPEHARLAETIVGQAAVAVQNAWLFEQVRLGRERLQSLSRRLVEVQENERRYIARELHDEAGQSLSSMMLDLRNLEIACSAMPCEAKNLIVQLKEQTIGVLEELRRLAMDLRPASLDHLGLIPALAQLVQNLRDRSPMEARFKTTGLGHTDRLPADVETTLYRIAQEALTNVARHAQASRVDVILSRQEDKIILLIEDNGIGFTMEGKQKWSGHLGLVGMQERAEMLGGSLMIESQPGAGTTLVVEAPYDDRTHAGAHFAG